MSLLAIKPVELQAWSAWVAADLQEPCCHGCGRCLLRVPRTAQLLLSLATCRAAGAGAHFCCSRLHCLLTLPGPTQSAALWHLHVSSPENGRHGVARFVLSSPAPDATCCQEAAGRLLRCSLPLLPAVLLPSHKGGPAASAHAPGRLCRLPGLLPRLACRLHSFLQQSGRTHNHHQQWVPSHQPLACQGSCLPLDRPRCSRVGLTGMQACCMRHPCLPTRVHAYNQSCCTVQLVPHHCL